MAAESRRNFSLLSKAFSRNFLRDFYPSRAQLQFNGKQKPQFYHISWFERLWWYRSQFLQTLHGFNPSVKVHAPENPYKNGEFLMCFYREKPSEIRY